MCPPSVERITGYSRDELIADPGLAERMVFEEDIGILEAHQCRDRHDPDPAGIDFRIRTKDGRVRWIAHFCVPIYGRDGSWLGRRSSNRDVTKRKSIEEQLRETNPAVSGPDPGVAYGCVVRGQRHAHHFLEPVGRNRDRIQGG